ncbi:MAG: hypothetical protein U9P12_07865, partial [Verrucomicrobiota bacterium]|nr:hypothetical protein [Verrucomicrobiota bacterium]
MMTRKIFCAVSMIFALIMSGTAWASITAPDAGGKLSVGFDGSDVTLTGALVDSWNDQVSVGGID